MKTKKLMKRLVAAATAMASAAVMLPVYADADCLGQNTFDENVGLPWHSVSNAPAEQHIELQKGGYKVTIVSPGGKNRGGESRWDCSFVHRNLHIEKGHKYKLHWELDASSAGELHTEINNNDNYTVGVWQNNSERWELGWNNVKISKGKNSFDSEFTADRTIENAAWVFHYGGAGPFQDQDCFPNGTSLIFDNMYLECETCGEVYKDEESTPCLWDPSNEMGKITPYSDVRVNHMGYYTNSEKRATYATSEEKSAVKFEVLEEGKTVYTGTGKVIGYDEDAGEYCQILDFSEVHESGIYTIVVDDEDNIYTDPKTGEVYKKYKSFEFFIDNNIYERTLKDALNYYYQNRSGMEIESEYVTADDHNGSKQQLAHEAFNRHDKAYIQEKWQKTYEKEFDGDKNFEIDVTGGWYTDSKFTKNVVTGANAVWLLQNMYERSRNAGTDARWADDKAMHIPQEYNIYGNKIDGTGCPDILDEARYELEWMFRMIVDPAKDGKWGNECEGLVYHEVIDHRNTGLAVSPFDYVEQNDIVRIVKPPTYAATFNMVACAAQAARLWRGIDDEFADKCLENAKKSWDAMMKLRSKWSIKSGEWKYDAQYAPENYVGTGADHVADEAYWAACELYSTTGEDEYYTYLSGYGKNAYDVEHGAAFDILIPDIDKKFIPYKSFDSLESAAKGTLTLALSDKTSDEDKKTISDNILKASNKLIDLETNSQNGMEIPYREYVEPELIGMSYTPAWGYEYASIEFEAYACLGL